MTEEYLTHSYGGYSCKRAIPEQMMKAGSARGELPWFWVGSL